MPKPIPEFSSEDEEREFWATHDSSEYLDWTQARGVIFPKLKPSTKTISLRLPESMLNELRLLANRRDVPYQSLLKVFLQERIDEEFAKQEALQDAAGAWSDDEHPDLAHCITSNVT